MTEPTTSEPSSRRNLVLGLALLAPVLLLVYAGLYDSWFLRDDFMWLRDAQRQWDDPTRFWTTRPSGYLRPVSNLFFGLEYAVFGLTATGYLVVNALLHLTNACLLAALLRALGAPLRLALAAAACAGLMVTASPGVVWISDIVSLLALGFVLAAALFHRRHVTGGRLVDGILAVSCVALAAGSRESGVLAGVGVILVELHAGGARVVLTRAFWKRLAPFVVLGGLYLAAQRDLASFDAVARSGGGGPELGAFLTHWVANLPALVAWSGRQVSTTGGLVVLAALVASLGILDGRRGLVAAAWLVGLLLLALLPYLLQLSASPTIAGRYRYEAVFVAAVCVAAVFSFAWGAAARLAGERARAVARAAAAAPLLVFLALHARATAVYVNEDPRFAVYADQTRAFVHELDALLEHWSMDEHHGGSVDGAVLVLAGAPIENERHLWDQLVVFHGWPDSERELVSSAVLDLTDPSVTVDLRSEPGDLLEAAAGELDRTLPRQAYVWNRGTAELVPADRAERVFGKLRHDWRRPAVPAKRTHLRVLHLTPHVRAALHSHTGPAGDRISPDSNVRFLR